MPSPRDKKKTPQKESPPRPTVLPPPPILGDLLGPSKAPKKTTTSEETQPTEEHTIVFQPAAGRDILQELKEAGFTSMLRKAETPEDLPPEHTMKKEFVKSALEYESGGRKYEEIGLFESAAVNYAAAAMSYYLAGGPSVAAHHLVRYVKDSNNPQIFDHAVFQSTKNFLKAVLSKDMPALIRVDEAIRDHPSIAYGEDKELFRRCLSKGRRDIEGH